MNGIIKRDAHMKLKYQKCYLDVNKAIYRFFLHFPQLKLPSNMARFIPFWVG